MQHYTEHRHSIKHTYHKSNITLNNTNAALKSTDTALHRTQMQHFTERNYTYLHSSTTLSYTGAAQLTQTTVTALHRAQMQYYPKHRCRITQNTKIAMQSRITLTVFGKFSCEKYSCDYFSNRLIFVGQGYPQKYFNTNIFNNTFKKWVLFTRLPMAQNAELL